MSLYNNFSSKPVRVSPAVRRENVAVQSHGTGPLAATAAAAHCLWSVTGMFNRRCSWSACLTDGNTETSKKEAQPCFHLHFYSFIWRSAASGCQQVVRELQSVTLNTLTPHTCLWGFKDYEFPITKLILNLPIFNMISSRPKVFHSQTLIHCFCKTQTDLFSSLVDIISYYWHQTRQNKGGAEYRISFIFQAVLPALEIFGF